VVKIVRERKDYMELIVKVDGKNEKAVCYPELTGEIQEGDEVVLNTSAVALGLGTGGVHFVITNLRKESKDLSSGGHIMKLRYTPMQIKCWCAEEQESTQKLINDFSNLRIPVVVGTLHSQLPLIAAGIKSKKPNAKIAYMMTDGAALPIMFSNLVALLKEEFLIDATITVGHAFGGDFEAVNIYSGLIIAQEVAECDACIAVMGPGIVGTGSKYGFTGVEQGQVIHAVEALKGKSIAVPRISFADRRERHFGLSHHSQTIFGSIVLCPTTIGLPYLDEEKEKIVLNQLKRCGALPKHSLEFSQGEEAINFLQKRNIEVTTMGRKIDEDREFFLAAGACGEIAGNKLV
jgi:hypothetical protein